MAFDRTVKIRSSRGFKSFGSRNSRKSTHLITSVTAAGNLNRRATDRPEFFKQGRQRQLTNPIACRVRKNSNAAGRPDPVHRLGKPRPMVRYIARTPRYEVFQKHRSNVIAGTAFHQPAREMRSRDEPSITRHGRGALIGPRKPHGGELFTDLARTRITPRSNPR